MKERKSWYKQKKAVATPIYENDLLLLKRSRWMDENLVDTLHRLLTPHRKTRKQKLQDLLTQGVNPDMVEEVLKND